ncbi:MAG: SEL1-like repeat protein [Blautia sp.]|nr:SEL1-like repeat protein [Blautia sp.]
MKKIFLIFLLVIISMTMPVYSAEMELVDEGILVHGNCFEYICNTDNFSVEIVDTYPVLMHTEDEIKHTFAILASEDQMIGNLQEYSVKKAEDFFGVSFSEEDILDILPESFGNFEKWAGIKTNIWHKMSSDQVISASVYAMTDSTHTIVVMLSREGEREKIKDAGKRKNDAYFQDFSLYPTVEEVFHPSAESDQFGQYTVEKGEALYNMNNEEAYEKAMEWFLLSAKIEQASAQNYIGSMYQNGYGVEKDYTEAVKWYRKAADQGHADAQKNLGNMYYNGYGVEKDYTEAVRWYRKGADQGLAGCQKNMGWMYLNGYGVEKNYTEAEKWYRKAAVQGSAIAQSNMGWLYQNGLGIEKDYTEAVKWYRKAAEQGLAHGQYRLGIMYENGFGVEKDIEEAKKWYTLSAEQGNESAKEALTRIDSNLKPVLLKESGDHVPGNKEVMRSEIQRIVVRDTLQDVPDHAWDMSKDHNSSVMAWVTDDMLTIAGEGGVFAPESASWLFSDYNNVQSIDFGDCFHTEDTTQMDLMFFRCKSLLTLDVSGFDTSNVTNIECMFCECNALKSLNISGWNTTKVERMFRLFAYCTNLETLDLSSFDTRTVSDANDVFEACNNLQSIYVGENFVIWGATDFRSFTSDEIFPRCPAVLYTPDGKAYTQDEWRQSAIALEGLRRGNTGLAVTALQKLLTELGCMEGSADGTFGEETEKAMLRYQESADLETTGELDYETLKALRKVLSDD